MLNMCYYDVINLIPIDLTNNGSENRNKEIRMSQRYIKNHLNDFKNCIIICDRLYFPYRS